MLGFDTNESCRTGTAVLSFNIRSTCLPFFPVQHNFSWAKTDVLVCFLSGACYLPLSLSAVTLESTGQLQLNLTDGLRLQSPWTPSSFTKQAALYRTMTEISDLSEGKARPCYHGCESTLGCEPLWVLPVQGWLCSERASYWAWDHLPAGGKATRNQPSWTPQLMGPLSLLRRENILTPFASPTLS